MTCYIFITGGVVSSLGKGVTSASLGALLECFGFKITLIKLDPYINVDPGTMNPFQHGEVFVTQDGAETDLDLGYYERFVNIKMTKNNSLTSGRIYGEVIRKERNGEYLGETVQVIPHITDEIKLQIYNGAKNSDIALVEIGGTVGDIESLPFLEAIRQMRIELGINNTLYVHLTLVPFISSSGEIKTKPTQHSVKEMRSIGIQPDMLICRSNHFISDIDKKKIALFTNVEFRAVISLADVNNIYEIPLIMNNCGIGEFVIEKMKLPLTKPDLSIWKNIINSSLTIDKEIKIAMIGKYVNLIDAYKSVNEALIHAGIYNKTKINIQYIDAEEIENVGTEILKGINGIIIPGGFGKRGSEGMILAAEFSRINNIPFLGICLGMQIAVIEFARHVLKLTDANSTEFSLDTKWPIVALVTEWADDYGKFIRIDEKITDIGGTMRLGNYDCHILPNTLAYSIYKKNIITERYRHRYEINGKLINCFANSDLKISGYSKDGRLVELIELSKHKWFIGCQFHPEFNSNPRIGHPLFISFIKAAMK